MGLEGNEGLKKRRESLGFKLPVFVEGTGGGNGLPGILLPSWSSPRFWGRQTYVDSENRGIRTAATHPEVTVVVVAEEPLSRQLDVVHHHDHPQPLNIPPLYLPIDPTITNRVGD